MAHENAVVWYKLTNRGYPRWPCKVISPPDCDGRVQLDSFEDHHKYKELVGRLTPLVHADVWKWCKEDIAKCQQRPATFAQYTQAVKEAIEFERSKDPTFSPPPVLTELCQSTNPNITLPTSPPSSNGHTTTTTTTTIPTNPPQSSPLGRGTRTPRRLSSTGTKVTPAAATTKKSKATPTNMAASSDGGMEPAAKRRKGASLRTGDTPCGRTSLAGPSNGTSKTCPSGGGGGGGDGDTGEAPSVMSSSQPPSAVHTTSGEPTPAMSSVDGNSQDSEDSSGDDLPSINMTPKGSIRVKNLKGGEIIWAKYGRYPFWPAMVMKVNKAKKKAMVNFLGWTLDEHSIGVGNKNIAPFNYSQQESFLVLGRGTEWTEEFCLAFEEANTLLREDISGTPAERLSIVTARRPKSMKYIISPMTEHHRCLTGVEQLASAEEEEEEECCSNDVMDNGEHSSSDEEQVSPEYRYDVLKTEFEALKPQLVSIAEGKVPSELHKVYCSGTKEERRAMTQSTNFGPASRLPTKLLNQLLAYLETVAKEATTEHPFGHKYSYDVLFPEAMMRTIAKRKGIPVNEAAKEVLQETMMDCLQA